LKIAGNRCRQWMKWLARRINSLKKAEIEKNITPHSFRHTHTSLLIEAGIGIKEIQQRLGHTDINTTMNIYAHMTANMEEKASQQFSKLMKDLLL
jgi:integrase